MQVLEKLVDMIAKWDPLGQGVFLLFLLLGMGIFVLIVLGGVYYLIEMLIRLIEMLIRTNKKLGGMWPSAGRRSDENHTNLR
jgi:hypothetical protein